MGGAIVDIWVIYDKSIGEQSHYVARKWRNSTPTDVMIADDVLRTLQLKFTSMGSHNLSRFEAEDPTIIECWI